jgi:hypothetical protein
LEICFNINTVLGLSHENRQKAGQQSDVCFTWQLGASQTWQAPLVQTTPDRPENKSGRLMA